MQITPPPPQNLVFACYLHIYIHIYTYILPFPPLQPRISTLFAALESHDLVNGPCLPVYFYHNLFFEPPIACLAHGLQHICYLWITQSLPMQTQTYVQQKNNKYIYIYICTFQILQIDILILYLSHISFTLYILYTYIYIYVYIYIYINSRYTACIAVDIQYTTYTM